MKIPESFSNVILGLLEKQKQDQEILQQRIASLGDEIAKKTSWIPLSSAGANFSIYCLKQDKNGNYYITGTWQSYIFGLIFLIVGTMSGFVFLNGQNGLFSQGGMWIFVPVIISGAGIFIIVRGFKKKIFDFYTQSFYSYFFSKKTDGFNGDTPLQNIHAIQILSSLHSSSPRYYNYQINIVLKDSSRKNITTFSNISTCQESAGKIAQRLNVPVWDISDILTYPSIITTGNPGN